MDIFRTLGSRSLSVTDMLNFSGGTSTSIHSLGEDGTTNYEVHMSLKYQQRYIPLDNKTAGVHHCFYFLTSQDCNELRLLGFTFKKLPTKTKLVVKFVLCYRIFSSISFCQFQSNQYLWPTLLISHTRKRYLSKAKMIFQSTVHYVYAEDIIPRNWSLYLHRLGPTFVPPNIF